MTTPTGILGDTSEAAWAEARRLNEERRQNEAEAAEAAARIQYDCDVIDAALTPHLRDELAAENKIKRITDWQKADFKKFQAWCEQKAPQWPCAESALPAKPEVCAMFLSENSASGIAHVSRLVNSISTVHRALNFNDPCEDVLVRALLRQIRNDTSHANDGEKGNQHEH